MKKMLLETVIRIFLYILITFTTFSLVFFFLYSHPPRNISITNPLEHGLKYERTNFITADGISIDGWFIENKKSDKIIIAMHGYPMDKGNILEMITFLAHKYNVFMFDFRAMGRSEGFFSTGGEKENLDLDAAIKYLQEKGFRKIGVFGFSLGGSVALLSNNENIKAIVADSPFDGLKEELIYSFSNFGILKMPLVFMINFWGSLFTGVSINNIRISAKKISKPTIIFHGENDTVTPLKHSLKIKNSNPQVELIIVKNAEHGQCKLLYPEYEKKILFFFEKYLK